MNCDIGPFDILIFYWVTKIINPAEMSRIYFEEK